MTGTHVLKSEEEVNKAEIEVVKAPAIESILRRCLDLHLRSPFSRCNPGPPEKSYIKMGIGYVPELKINLAEIGVLNQERLDVSTL